MSVNGGRINQSLNLDMARLIKTTVRIDTTVGFHMTEITVLRSLSVLGAASLVRIARAPLTVHEDLVTDGFANRTDGNSVKAHLEHWQLSCLRAKCTVGCGFDRGRLMKAEVKGRRDGFPARVFLMSLKEPTA